MIDPSLYPFTGRFLYPDGIRYHFLDEGQGAPVVCVHGNPSWSFYFRNLVLALRDRFRVIVPDHIGCGLSDKPDDSRYAYTLERRWRDLEFLLEVLGVQEKISLVLHDWGGMIGMAYAVRHPERIKKLVVLNTGAFHLPRGKRFPWQLRLCRLPLLGSFLVRGLNLFCKGAARSGRPMSERVRQGYLSPYDSWQHRIAVQRFVQDIPLDPAHPTYPLVSEVEAGLERLRDIPMLIAWGERDFVFDRHFLEEWRRRFPQAEVHRFADAGHYILEDAADDVIALVRKFLSGV